MVTQAFKNGVTWNLNLIIKLMEYFLLRDPKISIKKIITKNILNFLLSLIQHDIVKNLFMQLFDPMDRYLCMDPKLQPMIWKHAVNVIIFNLKN
jgi:hypothetical protein